MSVDTCFYAVSKINSELAEPLERDKLSDDYEYVDQEKASDWMKEIGQLRTLRYTYVNEFALCEKLYGKKPKSISFPASEGIAHECRDENGDLIGVLTLEIRNENTETGEIKAYVFRAEKLTCIDNSRWLEAKEGIVTYEYMMELVKKCVDECEWGYPSSYHEALPELLKIAYAIENGTMVWCRNI